MLDALPPGIGIATTFGKAGELVKRSIDGRNFIREHRVLARL